MDFDFCDAGCWRRLRFQILDKGQQPFLGALQKNLNSFLAIQYPSGKRIGASQTIHKRPKANALHHAANSNGTSAGHSHSTSTKQLRPTPIRPQRVFYILFAVLD
jgi:hypothetical protein